MTDYKNKYLKYKNKYQNLKKISHGGNNTELEELKNKLELFSKSPDDRIYHNFRSVLMNNVDDYMLVLYFKYITSETKDGNFKKYKIIDNIKDNDIKNVHILLTSLIKFNTKYIEDFCNEIYKFKLLYIKCKIQIDFLKEIFKKYDDYTIAHISFLASKDKYTILEKIAKKYFTEYPTRVNDIRDCIYNFILDTQSLISIEDKILYFIINNQKYNFSVYDNGETILMYICKNVYYYSHKDSCKDEKKFLDSLKNKI